MKKKIVIGISIISVIVVTLASLSNVVGCQTVQSTNQIKINNEVNQNELLFQTIADLANNKEIQQIILKSQLNRRGLFSPNEKFLTLNTPVVTKNQIKHLYFIGLLLTKVISKPKMQSIREQNQFSNEEMQKEITSVIQKNATLNWETAQLSNSKCDCDTEQTSSWHFPVLCGILLILFWTFLLMCFPFLYLDYLGLDLLAYFPLMIFGGLYYSIQYIGKHYFHCYWTMTD